MKDRAGQVWELGHKRDLALVVSTKPDLKYGLFFEHVCLDLASGAVASVFEGARAWEEMSEMRRLA